MFLYILICIIAVIIGLAAYNAYWSSPFKLIFLLGEKGSGKTTLLMKYMIAYAKKGYAIYTNVKSCALPFATIIDEKDVGLYVARPKSLIALDEVGIVYDARKWKQFRSEWSDYYRYQRQYKNVVVQTSQAWDCDKRVRSLCDQFYLIKSFGAVGCARRFTLGSPFAANENTEGEDIRWVPFGRSFFLIPRYAKYFSSFSPPPRPLLEEVALRSVSLEIMPRRSWRRSIAKGNSKGVFLS